MNVVTRLVFLLVAGLVGAGSASAMGNTWVVDDNGGAGVHFTDLPPAIAAAAPGDVLVVRAGSYSGFTLDKELTIVADGGATAGVAIIRDVALGAQVFVSGLYLRGLQVLDCDGPVIIAQQTTSNVGSPSGPAAYVRGSVDVRFQGCVLSAQAGIVLSSIPRGGLLVDSSRVELASCSVVGADAEDDDTLDSNESGGYGVRCVSSSRVHIALTSASGGDGGDACYAWCTGYGGNGGAGIELTGNSTAIVAGRSSNLVIGGNFGHASFDGTAGPGIRVEAGSTLRWSLVTIQGGGPPCCMAPSISNSGGTVVHASPPDPTLALSGGSAPGSSMALTFYGMPGTNARLQQGNVALVEDDGLATIEKLANRIRLHPLGPLPPVSGAIVYPLTVPSNWVPGQQRVFQGLEIDGATAMLIERTNSTPFVVH